MATTPGFTLAAMDDCWPEVVPPPLPPEPDPVEGGVGKVGLVGRAPLGTVAVAEIDWTRLVYDQVPSATPMSPAMMMAATARNSGRPALLGAGGGALGPCGA